VAVRKHIESEESFVIQERWSDPGGATADVVFEFEIEDNRGK
jgi:hypothetical protein